MSETKNETKNETDAASFDRFVDAYDTFASNEQDNSFFLENLTDSRGAALDIGSGTGVLALELASRYDKVVGIDISEAMIDRARALRWAPNLEYLLMDAAHLDLGQKFDLIVSRNTFHHVEDVPATLKLLVDHLLPGGRIVIVDCINRERLVDRVPRPPDMAIRAVFRAGALAWYPRDRRLKGRGIAGNLLRARLNRAWLDHLISDRYLARGEFREIYGSMLAGAEFADVNGFYAVRWQSAAL